MGTIMSGKKLQDRKFDLQHLRRFTTTCDALVCHSLNRGLLACALATLTAFVLALFLMRPAANAAESGTGFYLLGSKGPLAGIVAPPGLYLANDTYIYAGSVGAGRNLPIGGRVEAGIDATAYIDLTTGLWVLPQSIMGGNLALSATIPWGGQDIDASASVVGAGVGASAHDNVFTVGDPVLGAALGWHAGNWHWTTGLMVNVPVGDYQKGEIANIAFHHWGADLNGALTWLNPALGWDVSTAVGVTFNAENPTTDYRTGTEFHLEGAVTKMLSPSFSLGPVGYYYQQISGDSGAGARLGDFRGRVAALGGTAAYSFQLGNTPVSTRLKVYREFAVENRLEGTAGYLSLSFPIGAGK